MTDNNGVLSRHYVLDMKTGVVYGIVMDGAGNCKSAQSLNVLLQKSNGAPFADGSPVMRLGASSFGMPGEALPYGQTTYAIELKQDGKKGDVFTLVWPSQEETAKGLMPQVAKKELPEDLIKAGLASPLAVHNKKGAAVSSDEELKEALKNIDVMIGLDKAKKDIKQNIAVARFNQMKIDLGLATKPISRHMVFTGNPGTGKTTFAREVAKVYHALGFIDKPNVHEVTREDLVAGFVGQTALKTKEQIEKAKGGILFIDEAYALSRGAGGQDDGKDFGREAIDTLVAAMENMREDLIVIVAGYSEPMKKFIDANPGLKSRFMTYIGFEDYSMQHLGEIFDVMVKDRGYTITAEARAKAMELLDTEKSRAGEKDFGNGRTVRNLVEKAEKELAMRLETENKLNKNHGLTDEQLKKELTSLTLTDIQKVSLDALGTKVEKGITFGGKTAPAPANDIKPAAPALKASIRPEFGR